MRRRVRPPPPPPAGFAVPLGEGSKLLPDADDGVREALRAVGKVAFVIGWVGAGFVGVVAVRMMMGALEMMSDDLLFFLGLIVFWPLALLMLSLTTFLAGIAWRVAPDRALEGIPLALAGIAVAIVSSFVFF